MSTSIAETHSIFALDRELEDLCEEITEAAEAGPVPSELQERFAAFCEAFGEKVDRIGRFLKLQESLAEIARREAQRLNDRVHSAEQKARSTKEMLLYFMLARGIRRLEGRTFTLRAQNNSQDTIKVENPENLPMVYRRVELRIDGAIFARILTLLPEEMRAELLRGLDHFGAHTDAIRAALDRGEELDGVRRYRGQHIRVA